MAPLTQQAPDLREAVASGAGLRRPRPPAPAGPARPMADPCCRERSPALPTRCQRAPRRPNRRRGGGDAALEPGPDRRPDQPPEDAQAPDVRPGPASSAGPTLPPHGLTRQGSPTTPSLCLHSQGGLDLPHQMRPRTRVMLQNRLQPSYRMARWLSALLNPCG